VSTSSSPEPPTRRGWIVLATTFVTLVVTYGAWYSYSVFLVALLREFGWSRSLVSGAFSVFTLVHGAFAPAVGVLLRRVGPRAVIAGGSLFMTAGLWVTAQTTEWWHLYLGFGGIAAIGMSLTGWVPSVVLLQRWFPERVATAIGIGSAGIGVGIFALLPLAQILIDWWGWRWAYRIFGLFIAAWVVPATLLLIHDPQPSAPSAIRDSTEGAPPPPAARTSWTLANAMHTWRFWGVAVVYFTGCFVTQMLLIHHVAYLVDHGISPIIAATVGGLAGLVSIPAKIGWGALADRKSRELVYTIAFGAVIASIGLLVLAGWYPSSVLPYVYGVVVGLGYGVMAPVPSAVASDLYAGPSFSTIYGVLYTVMGLGLAIGTWSAGEIFDRTGSYAGALWLGLGNAVLSPIALWVVAPRRPNPAPGGDGDRG
jgi:MFS family permease